MFKKQKKTCCVILCGGLGTRISEITKKKPKPMIKIFKKPIIFYILKKILSSKCEKIFLPLGYKGEVIRKYINSKFKKNLNRIDLINTGKNTSIGRRIKKIKNQIDKYDNFLLVNGDTVFDANIDKMINFHNKRNNDITLTYAEMKTSWGSFFVNKKKILYNFSKNDTFESINQKKSNSIGYRNSGISLIKTKCLDITNLDSKDFETNLFNATKRKQKIKLYDLKFDFWYPIETINDYKSVVRNNNLSKKLKKLAI